MQRIVNHPIFMAMIIKKFCLLPSLNCITQSNLLHKTGSCCKLLGLFLTQYARIKSDIISATLHFSRIYDVNANV